MNKLYLFGIGGTGSRVIKSLTMLLAAGVECNVKTIVPIIIDPDDASADLTRTVELIKKYTDVRNHLDFSSNTKNQFFKTEILDSVQNFRLPLTNTRDVKFKEYMGVNTMSTSNQALVNILFSQKNLNSDMKVGFKGNPNIGSVVLNQFADSPEFLDFANSFQQGDKIFIISSIFGGTGASGFPLVLKTLRSNTKIPNFKLIQDARIGAVSVLPYFGVSQDNNSEVDSATFISKTKSALSYYERNISDNNSIDTLYYLSDDVRGQYENHEGGVEQKNDAHIIELIAALSILDFIKTTPSENGIRKTVHKEFGLSSDSNQVIFDNFDPDTQDLIQKPLTRFLLFNNYFKNFCLKQSSRQPWAKRFPWDKKESFDASFFNTQFVRDLRAIFSGYEIWLKEMDASDGNKRRFSSLKLSDEGEFFDVVKGKEVKPLFCLSSNRALVDNYLNKQIGSVEKNTTAKQQFVDLFYGAMDELVTKKIKF